MEGLPEGDSQRQDAALQTPALDFRRPVALHAAPDRQARRQRLRRDRPQRLDALFGRRRVGREQHPQVDARRRHRGGGDPTAHRRVLQHRHPHLSVGAQQGEGRGAQGQGDADRRQREVQAAQEEQGRQAQGGGRSQPPGDRRGAGRLRRTTTLPASSTARSSTTTSRRSSSPTSMPPATALPRTSRPSRKASSCIRSSSARRQRELAEFPVTSFDPDRYRVAARPLRTGDCALRRRAGLQGTGAGGRNQEGTLLVRRRTGDAGQGSRRPAGPRWAAARSSSRPPTKRRARASPPASRSRWS